MTIAIVSTAQTTTGSPSNHAAITGVATGNLYLDIAHNAGGGTAPALDTTSAFSTISSGTDAAGRTFTYGFRVRTGAEGSLSATGSGTLLDIFFAVSGNNTSTPIESIQQLLSFGGAQTVPASTQTEDNAFHILIYANTND